ncbi:hypothetical protein EC968_004055 [Mortierella alpina]|nr:hypothetical protein EC968_004055 [Mortierella alpina]
MANPTALKQRHPKAPSSDHSSQDYSAIDNKHGLAPPKKVHSAFSPLRTVLSAWGIFLAFMALLVLITYQIHYTLPTPVRESINPVTGEVQFSEENVRVIVRHLSEDIGYRVVGTEQELETKQYLIKELTKLKDEAHIAGLRRPATDDALPNFDMWVQMYTNMTNIVVRLSCGPECDQNSVLLNAHYDTTLGSPGAADDALGVGVMMEMIRVLSLRPAAKKNSIVFLFNGGEESLQDASHAFITSHELKENIRAVVNLEACGTSGPEILFQANSRAMIDAYGTVPYPHGTVLANDLFATGLILSDTDFRQFVDHGNLTGLDMAVYKNSYLYHTHLDLDEFMEAGLPQHMGENTLALATFLTEKADLVDLESTASVVFFDVFGQFFVSYSLTTALRIHLVVGGLALLSIVSSASRPTLRATVSIFLSFLAALVLPNLSVILLQSLGKPMQWFTHEWWSCLLFGPVAFAGMFLVQYFFHDKKASTGANELSTFSGVQVFYTLCLGLASYVGFASSYVFALYSLSCTIALFFNQRRVAAAALQDDVKISNVDYTTYFVGALMPTAYFSFVCFSLLDIFIPLTGRIGVDAPVDSIVAVLTGFICFVFCPPILAFTHRFGRAVLKKLILALLIAHLVILLISAIFVAPYDELHPKRVFVQHLRNMTSGESILYVAHADAGPLGRYVSQVESLFETKAQFKSGAENPGDWNSIYPFSQFLDSFVLDTTPYIKAQTKNQTIAQTLQPLTDFVQEAPQLMAENVSYDPETGTRKLTVLCTHPHYIWTVASFDTELVSWSLSSSSEPFPHRSHYVIRHVGGYVSDGWRLDLEYRASGPEDRLKIELTAMETEGFGKDEERELIGSGDIGVMRKVLKTRPEWVTLTYFGTTVSHFML